MYGRKHKSSGALTALVVIVLQQQAHIGGRVRDPEVGVFETAHIAVVIVEAVVVVNDDDPVVGAQGHVEIGLADQIAAISEVWEDEVTS